MSTLLDEIIAARKAKAIEYEEYLKRMGELTRQAATGHSDETPKQLDTPGKRALYNNLKRPSDYQVADSAGVYHPEHDPALRLALELDAVIRSNRPDDWRGIQAREQVVKKALYDVLKDVDEVERIFKIVFQQHEY